MLTIRLPAFIAAALLLASCSRQPAFYSPQEVRAAAPVLAPAKLSHFTAMNAPGAANHIVSGILALSDGSWRWCMKRAELQFRVPVASSLRFRAELAISEMTFKQTGPVRIEVAIDERSLDTIVFDKPGNRTLELDVPDGTLPADRPVRITLTADKEWTAPDTGERRAFILTSAGFVQ